jgi:hypothetical protein
MVGIEDALFHHFGADWLVFVAARESEKRACAQTTADSNESEDITSGWQHCLHRATIDMSPVNIVAREF